jgi:hypothetical protein
MKNAQRVRESLLGYLAEKGIQFSQVSRDELQGKAVVEFAFNLGVPPSILWGSFRDKTREIISVAHEAGHVMLYKKMNRDEARTYLCTMFASHGIGLDKISPTGQEFILGVEAEASANGIRILKETGVDEEDLRTVKELMSKWYASYEKLCQKEVVKKVREKIIENKDTTFLVSDQAQQLTGPITTP